MKHLKNLIIALVLLTVIAACQAEMPRVRVQNQNQEIVDVALKPPSGSTININDVSAGAQSRYIDVPTSQYEVDVNIENVSSQITSHFQADEDESYTIIIDNNSPPTVKVNKP